MNTSPFRIILHCLTLFCLGFGFLALPVASAQAAGQTVNVGTAVTGVNNIYGNGADGDTVTSSGNGSATLDANGNTVNINAGGSVANGIFGGFTATSGNDASNNYVNVYSGNNGIVTGGWGGIGGQANNNHVLIDSGVGTVSSIMGGSGQAGASGNTITLSGGTFSGAFADIIGAQTAFGNAINNIVTINAFSGSLALVAGSNDHSTTYDTFTGNTLNMNNTSGGTITNVARFEYINFGSGVTNPDISNLFIHDGQDVKLDVGSGENVNLGTTIKPAAAGDVGGITKTGAGTLTLSGANTYTGMTEVRAGTLALTGSLASNLLTLHGGTTFDASVGTHSLDNGALHVHGQATYTGNLSAQNALLNFYVPTTMSNGGTMLSVGGTAYIDNATVNVGIEGGSSPLAVGDSVVLIDAVTLDGTPANTTANGRGMQGVTLLYGFDLLAQGSQLMATVTSTGVNPQIKSLSEGRVAGHAFLNQGSDLILGSGLNAMLTATQGAVQGGFVPFFTGAGGRSRYDTGSHVDVSGVSIMTGLAWRQPVNEGKNGSVLAGAFFEGGWGNYDSHNSFSNAASVKGDGDLSYYGGGVLGRYDFAPVTILGGPGNLYLDASFRAGQVNTDFNSSNLRDSSGRKADYDSSAAYYGMHAGLGYLWNIMEKTSLDFSTRYIWTHQDSDTVNVLGDPVKFKESDSHRWRTGARFAHAVNEYVAPYAGAYYDHEFDGKARASTNGYGIDAPDLKGGTGIGELGLTLKPSQTLPLSFDLGVQGYTGVREGVTGSLQVKFEF